jgi:hypothetical protein
MTFLPSSSFRLHRVAALLFAVLFVLAPFRFATAQPALKPSASALISVNVSVISLDKDITGLKYDSLGRSAEMMIRSSYKSLHVLYSGTNPLVLYRETKGDVGKPVKTSVIEINFPQTSGTFLVLVKQISADRYYTRVIRDDQTAVSPNSLRVINLSSRHIGFVLAEFKKSASLASGQTQEIDLGTKDGYADSVGYLPDPKNPGKWAQACSNRYLHVPGSPRTIILLDVPGDPRSLDTKILDNAVRRSSARAVKPGAGPVNNTRK